MSGLRFDDQLDEETREKLYVKMRLLSSEIDRLERHSRSMNSGNGIAVGAAGFDAFMEVEVRREFLSCLRRGKGPETAYADTLLHIRQCVANHNSKRPDVNWKRSDVGFESVVRGIFFSFREFQLC